MRKATPNFYEQLKSVQLHGGGGGQKVVRLYIYQGSDGKVYQDANGKVYASKRKGA